MIALSPTERELIHRHARYELDTAAVGGLHWEGDDYADAEQRAREVVEAVALLDVIGWEQESAESVGGLEPELVRRHAESARRREATYLADDEQALARGMDDPEHRGIGQTAAEFEVAMREQIEGERRNVATLDALIDRCG